MEQTFIELIGSLGFPIACVVALGSFAWVMVKRMNEINAKNMDKLQEDCKQREEKLYAEITENRIINGKFAEIIAKYEIKLDEIQKDVKEIKHNIQK